MIKRREVVRQPERPHKQRLDRVRLISLNKYLNESPPVFGMW